VKSKHYSCSNHTTSALLALYLCYRPSPVISCCCLVVLFTLSY
jgi:hypothetical protein